MCKDEKINLILDYCRRNPEAIPVLENRLKRQPATRDPQVALACYLTRVIAENSRLQLQGIRSASGLVSIDLEEVYITFGAVWERRPWRSTRRLQWKGKFRPRPADGCAPQVRDYDTGLPTRGAGVEFGAKR